MAWWLCFALWLSTLLVSVLGPAFVQWGLTCEVVRGDRIGLQSATNFDSFGTRRPANLRHGARVWRPGCAPCGNGSRAGSRGDRRNGLQPAAGPCVAT